MSRAKPLMPLLNWPLLKVNCDAAATAEYAVGVSRYGGKGCPNVIVPGGT
jgi:hypothetical protein